MKSDKQPKMRMPKDVKAVELQAPSRARATLLYEVDAVPGLERIAYQELQQRLGKQIRFRHRLEEVTDFGAIQFFYSGSASALLQMRTVLSAYVICFFDVPRPQALLGHAHFHQLLEKCKFACQLSAEDAFATLYVDAAGADSSVMRRLKTELAVQLGLQVAASDGDLVLRIRRAQGGNPGWEVLIRLSSRPLSVRRWRVCDRQGGLNAAVAHGMVLLTEPRPGDSFLNVGCGSGTLLVERQAQGMAQCIFGCDIDAGALDCARANVAASGSVQQVELYSWDARALPLPAQSMDVICGDLPFGKSIGSHQANLELYPRLLHEAARVAKPGARACFLTQEIRLMEQSLESSDWEKVEQFNLTIGGLRPRLYLLTRKG